jgi:hypothetical protein
MKFNLYLALFTTIFSSNLIAQTTEHSGIHDHHKNEFGIANAPVYFIKEKVFAYGLHIHYLRNIPKSKFGIGLGYERIFDAHKHNTLGLVATYRPMDRLSINLSPGLTFEEEISNANFALHIETAYEFEINDFHIGPVFEFAYDPEDIHISLGLHIGIGF